MISEAKTVTLVLEKEKEETETISPRILDLRNKIQDESYINNAIQRIAQVISRKLVEEPDCLLFGIE